MKCVGCGKEYNGILFKWCSMECKEKTFKEDFENSQWTTKMLLERQDLIFKKIEACLFFPWEGTLSSGPEIMREHILNDQRRNFNKLRMEFS